MWLVVATFAWQLAPFFGIFMGTFILTFIGRSFTFSMQNTSHFARFVSNPDTQRKALVICYFVFIAVTIGVFGVMTIPYIAREAADFILRLQSENIWVVVLEKMRMGLGDNVMEQLERFLLMASQENVLKIESLGSNSADWSPERLVSLGGAIHSMLQGYFDKAITFTSSLLSWVTRFTLQVSISLILSFMLLWDWPNIAHGVDSLKASRLQGIYKEVAPSMLVFAQLFGMALQAQTRIALMNTALTALGMWFLGIPGLLLLSLFVFLCSFIPVAGCILSTVPIGFVALTEYGFLKLALVILMVFLVHVVEAYGLNPAIYSAHLRLHPLLVLTVLVFAEHSIGVWGLLLAVPATVFALDYCIRYPEDSMHDVATKELQYVQGNRQGNRTSFDDLKAKFTPTPGFTPDDNFMSCDMPFSPEAKRLISE